MGSARKKDEIAALFFDAGGVVAPTDVINGDNEYLGKIVEEVYSVEDIEVKTDLNQAQIDAYSLAQEFHARYNVPVLEGVVKRRMVLAVSKGRKGRKEFARIASSIYAMNSVEPENKGILPRLIGKE